MKTLLIILTFALTFATYISKATAEESIKHLEVADVTSMTEAKKVFQETTSLIKSKQTLDATELHEIHFITYSLEKSIAYFAENLTDKNQALAKEIAVVVEDIHINSENNRKEKTRAHLKAYFDLANELAATL